ncbi:T9SS type A sorting domain-containing protein [bacterium]|nr:T9SS type A sorting domain-containing protein [bacterium]
MRIPLLFLILLPLTAVSQTFNDFLARLNIVSQAERPAIVDSFMNAQESFPYIENDTTMFMIYRGTANSVTVAGDMNSWNPNGHSMSTVAGTDFWYRGYYFESDARIDYKYVLNGGNWILDPRNPYTCTGGYGPNSELRMPQYISPPEVEYYANIEHGSLQDTSFYSTNLGNSRTIRVYLPYGYAESEEHYPVMLFHDGLEYITLSDADNVLDYLIYHDRIVPIIGVFVPPVNRSPEYAGDQQAAFGRFITEEVMPWVDGRFRTRTEPELRGTIGASNGGNISLYLGVTYPEQFGKIGAQSSNVETNIRTAFSNNPLLDLELYLDMGTYDIAVLPPLVEALIEILDEKGYPYEYYEWHEGHSWCNWAAHLDLALTQFFPGSVNIDSPLPALPTSVKLLANYPNPFNPETTIRFELNETQEIELAVYNTSGQLVRTLVAGLYEAGGHAIQFDGTELPSGVYFYSLKWNGGSSARKMVLLK